MKSKIRPMTIKDIDRVHAIELFSHRAPWSQDILKDCVLVGYDCRVLELSARGKKQVMGYMICRFSYHVCHILNLCITSAKQRQGYGKSLLLSLFESLKKTDIEQVILEVRPSNYAAMALYEGFGFKQDIIKEGYYNDEQGAEDAILLKKIIKS